MPDYTSDLSNKARKAAIERLVLRLPADVQLGEYERAVAEEVCRPGGRLQAVARRRARERAAAQGSMEERVREETARLMNARSQLLARIVRGG